MGILYGPSNEDTLSENNNTIINIKDDFTKKDEISLLNKLKIQKQNNFILKKVRTKNVINNNSILQDFSFYNDSIIMYEMKKKFIKEKEDSLKNEIKNEIKGELIIPLSNTIQKKDLEIKEIKAEFENKIKLLNNESEKLKINNNQLAKLLKENECKTENLKKESNEKFEQLNKKIKELIAQMQLSQKKLEEKKKRNYNIIKESINKYKTILELKKNNQSANIDELLCNINEKLTSFKNKKNVNQDHKKDDNGKNKDKEIDEIEDELNKLYNEIPNNEKNKNNEYSFNNDNKIKQYNKLKDDLKICILNKRKIYQNEVVNLFSKKGYGKVGLKNESNNCYIISMLQILKNIPQFTLNFIKLEKKDTFLDSLKELLINICKANKRFFSPNRFKDILGVENNKFYGNKQYDSTIFYISLLNIIHKKLNIAKREDFIKYDKLAFENENLSKKFDGWKQSFLSKNKSFIIKMFYIFYVNRMKCTSCNKITHTFQSSNFFDFPIVSKSKNVESLIECFENFQELSELKNDENFDCKSCGKLSLNLQFIILELPPILMINLKRVGEKQSYYNDIEIPFELEMGKIIKNSNINTIYELRGFIKHNGTERAGHNYAFCKNMFDEKWYEYNDKNCNPIDGTPTLDKIFFLCYIKIGNNIDYIGYLKEITNYLNDLK